MQYKDFGKFLRYKRTKDLPHKSLNSFAFDNNIEPAVLSRVETLKQDIKLSVIEKIANAYKIKISELMKEYEDFITEKSVGQAMPDKNIKM